jgi:uncharacterized membrane protein YeaQ/YmgE (transglycosylase-associated protein family)
MSILWTIIIGFVAGVIAKFLYPGNKYEPTGFILTTVLGIIGAFVATYLGQAIGWYKAGEGAGVIGAIVGAIIILAVWGFIAPRLGRTSGPTSAGAQEKNDTTLVVIRIRAGL